MIKRLLVCNLLLFISFTAKFQNNTHYTHKNFGTYFEEFREQKDLTGFLQVRKGNVVADVGAGDGYFTCALTLLYDSVTIFAEDISRRTLKEKRFKRYINRFAKLKTGVQTNTFHISIGTYSTTNLPDRTFDKIVMMASFHEFSNMNAMIKDIAGKLKEEGKVYIMEAFSLPGDTIYCADKHKGYSIEQAALIMKQNGLFLSQMKCPEGKLVDYSNCLVFEKSDANSKRFYEVKDLIEPLINLSRQLGKLVVATNKARVRSIADSLMPAVVQISAVYATYESWLRSIGNKWMQKQKYACAVNVFDLVCSLYPSNPKNYFVLATAYQANAQYAEALNLYKKAHELDPLNTEATRKVKLLSLGVNSQ